MNTRAELRLMLRRRLEDTSGTPLWDDATLNDLLTDAVRHYGIRFPAEKTVSVTLAGGAITSVVSPYLDESQVRRVRDATGVPIPRMRWPATAQGWSSAQAWRWWDGKLVLAQPATAGEWEIEYLGRRVLPGDDVALVDVRAGDEEIVILLAASAALLRRAVEHGKRGSESAGLALTRVAECHSREAERLIAARRRRATGGWNEE